MKRILIVDDYEGFRKYLANHFKDRAEYSVTTASNGLEAFMLCKKHKYDVLITDWKMPGLDGIELISKVKVLQDSIKTILISTYQFEEEEFESTGADACLHKGSGLPTQIDLALEKLMG